MEEPQLAARNGWLGRYFDAGLDIPDDLTSEVITADEIDRLAQTLAIVFHASTMKRRLGIDATREDLALDKRRARRTAWALKQALMGWTGKLPSIRTSEEIDRAGAQIVWTQFKADHSARLQGRLAIVATWAMLHDEVLFGNKAVVKLNNELNWVSYALRD